jgi:formylglycine-generating enzyme required for sulfatase activity
MVLALLATAAQAVIIDMVPVGNTLNTPDDTGFGAVVYAYSIGKYEVTAGQYRDFLNAVDPTGANALGLYNIGMADNTVTLGCQITLNSDAPNGSKYDFSGRPSGSEADWANRPVNLVSFWDAARFANWFHNGQGSGDTETGAYINIGLNTFARQPGALFFIPTENEWYKAAFHANDGNTGNYFDYPTSSDTAPSNALVEPTDPGNNATFYDRFSDSWTIGPPYYRTEVGAHENSDSPSGTFDQGGNVWEWNETAIGDNRGLRGGSFSSSYVASLLASSRGTGWDPTSESSYAGFRVASTPELTADFDQDGDVDGDDFLIWRAGFNVDDRGDANADGVTDGDDFLIWQSEFGSGSGAGSAAVPEPTSVLLAFLACAAACGALNRRRRPVR